MEINWFTFIAQILNFFLLVWLLKRFLYKPILNAIDKREKSIVAKLKDAEVKEAEAQKEQKIYREKITNFDLEKKALLDKAISESKEQKKELLEKARKEAEILKNKLEKSSREKLINREAAISLKIQDEVFAVSRKALSELASSDLEQQATLTFIKNLKSLKNKELDDFISAFKNNGVLLKSAFSLSKEQQNAIQNQVNDLLKSKIKIQYEVAPELIAGIELSTKDYKISWSISGFLSDLEDQIFEKSEKNNDEKTSS
ncbi:F0F1 ATP synthase subunit delta [Algoriphagus sp. SE2]|uniref:F0F1 ATP synthase subunit delta n=1 Tax=Algoriphagus sp. SE2 TaxID=3141536 RepID=UPI0031CD3792